MDRIFRDGVEYAAIGIVTYSEEHFVQQVLSLAPLAYPGWHLVPFDPLVDCGSGILRKPDLALVAEDLSTWFVIEAEIAVHSLHGHVVPQVRDLSRANYATRDCADALIAALPSLDPIKITRLLRDEAPRMLVITLGSTPEWRPTLLGIPALLHVMRVFRSSEDEHLVLLDGPTLSRFDDKEVGLVRVLPSMLQLESNPSVKLPQYFSLEWDEEAIRCEIVTIGSSTSPYIQADGFRHIKGDAFKLVIGGNMHHPQFSLVAKEIKQ